MSIPDNTIIEATIGEDSALFSVESGQVATIFASGLSGVEAITLQILAGETYMDCYDFDVGAVLTITATQNPMSIRSPGYYKVVKPTTIQEVSVHLNK